MAGVKKNGRAYCLMEEQETTINFSRMKNYATVCTSDTTQKTRFDKLCDSNPEHWKKIAEDEVFSTYRCTPKTLISARSKVTQRSLTEEQRVAAAERMAARRSKCSS